MHVKATIVVKNVKDLATLEAIKAKVQVAADELAGDAAAVGVDLFVQAKVETLDFVNVGGAPAAIDDEDEDVLEP